MTSPPWSRLHCVVNNAASLVLARLEFRQLLVQENFWVSLSS